MRTFWAAAAAAVGSCVVSIAILGVPGAESGGGTLKVYNWGEYIDEDVITQFEDETGISVIYDVFETNEEMYPVVEAGGVKYDVVCPSDYMIQRMIDNNILAELDYDNIPNAKQIGDDYWNMSKDFDPKNQYAVPYCWGTVGILYNKQMLEQLGVPKPTSWANLWDPKLSDEILMQNSIRDAFMIALKQKGYSLNTSNPEELAEARDMLIQQKPLVQAYVIDQVRDKMINGEAAEGVIYSGEMLYIQEQIEELGLDYEVDVIAVGSHDTASAVFTVGLGTGCSVSADTDAVLESVAPATSLRHAFLSSGTWSLLGIELDEPVLTEEARLSGFTNEGGVGGKIRFLQNITGLWILQRLIAQWGENQKETEYDALISAAELAEITSVIDVDDPAFACPADMEVAIAHYCRTHELQVPSTQGEYVRCVLKSLAQRYKRGIEQLNRLLPAPVEALHIIGGGCRNKLLNRLTEEALGIPVYAGPVEATAIGNILVQALAKGEIADRREIKGII